MDDSTKKPQRAPMVPKKVPKLRVNGEVDRRSYNTGIPKGEEPKTAQLVLRITSADKEWLKSRPEGATAWIEARISEAKEKEH